MENSISKEQSNNNTTKHEAEIAYGFLLDLRNIDLKLLWTRSAFFFAINGALLGFLIRNLDADFVILLFLVFFGFGIALIWRKVTKLGCTWLVSWETQLRDIEDRVFPDSPDICIFRNNEYRGKIKGSIKKILIKITGVNTVIWVFLLLYVLFKKGLHYF